jgi:hypothetical protein
MRIADEQIMLRSCIQSNCRHINYNGNDSTIYCTFQKIKDWDSFDWLDGGVLRLLHIVSRGRAFRSPPKKIQGTFFASWFSPTTEWFSLPMFLASRFEVALWDSFEKQKSGCHVCTKVTERRTIIEDNFSRFSHIQVTRLMARSIAYTIKRILVNDLLCMEHLRDLFFHHFFYNVLNRRYACHVQFDMTQLHDIPLIFVSSVFDEFRKKLIEECEHQISCILETDLTRSQKIDLNACLKYGSVKKRKKKNKRMSRIRSRRSTLISIDEQKVEKYNSSQSSALNLPISREDFNEQKNQTTVFILGLIDEIMDTVFHEVGVTSSNIENDKEFLSKEHRKVKTKDSSKITAFVLRKRTASVRAIEKPQSIKEINLNSNQQHELFFENGLTVKRNNATNLQSIWCTQPPISVHSPFSTASMHYQGFLDLFTQSNNIEGQVTGNLHTKDDAAGFLHCNDSSLYDANDDRGFTFFDDLIHRTFADSHDDNFASSTAASLASSILDHDDSVGSSDDNYHHAVNYSLKNSDEHLQTKSRCFGLISEQYPIQQVPDTSQPMIKEGVNVINVDQNEEGSQSECLQPENFADDSIAQTPNVFLSLADLGELRRMASLQNSNELLEKNGRNSMSSTSGARRVSSREDAEISIDCDTSDQKKVPQCCARTVDFSVLSYKNAAMKHSRKARSVSSHEIIKTIKHLSSVPSKSSTRSFPRDITRVIFDGCKFDINICARSESALNDHENSSQLNVMPKSVNNNNDEGTLTKDGATTISSIPDPHEIDEIPYLKEERDSFRDMCLSMAAEISKLKNIIALEKLDSNYPMPRDANPFGSECIPSFYLDRNRGTTRKYLAMSDAGFNEVGDAVPATCAADHTLHRTSHSNNNASRIQSQKYAENSDNTSLDYDNATHSFHPPSRTIPCSKYSGPSTLHSLQSRLSYEIECFVVNNSEKLNDLEKKRKLAIERLHKLVTAIWPRAQVKAYGSQETGLRLPSSDLDFVISLPEVHKKAPADAPGDLEGRNAINETSQKLLARKLKSESWIGKQFVASLRLTTYIV